MENEQMFYLIHTDLPFWEILDSDEDPKILDALVPSYGSIPGGEISIVDSEGLARLEERYPQLSIDED